MIADEKGIQLDTLNDILDAYELQLQGKYGSDFHIKPEGVIDNIANSAGFMELSLQQQIAFLTKNLDPETAEGIYQDWIYERQGCYRLKPKKSIIELNVLGSANLKPTQVDASLMDSQQSFGSWIKKLENERPVSASLLDEYEDKKMAKYLRTWFSGHLAKALGGRNPDEEEYDDELSKYTVNPPSNGDDNE